MESSSPKVAVLMGSRSDWSTMEHAVRTLEQLEIPHDVRILSAHRTPEALVDYVRKADEEGALIFIAAAGGAAHLAGVIAAQTRRPVLGVPMHSSLSGVDSLLSMVQMPAGIPVPTLSVGKPGAVNAALAAAAILALSDPQVDARLESYRRSRAERVLSDPDPRLAPPE
jgi:5-(carboxyamino)imidazole ribonucleotide mutase